VAYAILSLVIIIASRSADTYICTSIHTNNLYGNRGGGISSDSCDGVVTIDDKYNALTICRYFQNNEGKSPLKLYVHICTYSCVASIFAESVDLDSSLHIWIYISLI